ncbi:phage holin family protein [Frankia sp. AgB1.9]|nr:phage holin family protein [Frankia sp. AgW1.1]MBL7546395.1 phage holin family protein [Frankia sp. AgB1.9]MBL7618560.1 phage holin family protein [Frankia sp. AgB1.8]
MTADRTATAGPGTLPGGRKGRRGAGALVSEVASDMSMLVRQEIDLAKAEVRQSAVRAGKGAGMFGGAAGAGVFAVLFLLLAAMFGLSEVMALGWAALIVAALLIVSAAVFALLGRANVKKAHAKPEQTVETLKEDMQWAHGLRK